MLGILWIVLKIIMWVLIGLIGLIIILVNLLLWVPIRYKIKGGKCVGIKGKGQVSFLLKFIRGNFWYQEKKLYYVVKVLFFTVVKEIQVEEVTMPEKEVPEVVVEVTMPEKEVPEVVEEAVVEEDKKLFEEKRTTFSSNQEEEVEKQVEKLKKKKNRKSKEKKKKIKKKKDTNEVLVVEQIKKWYTFFRREENAGLVKFLLGRIKKIIGSVLPRKFEGKFNFGSEDPAATGSFLAITSLFYPRYKDHVTLTADFEGARIEGYGQVEGRIILGIIVYHGVRVFMDRRIRRLIKEVRK